MIDNLLRLSRSKKRLFALSVDATLCVAATWAAYYLRMEQWIWLQGNQWLAVLAAVLLALPFFIVFGLYRTIFRHAGWAGMAAVAGSCLLYGAVYSLIFTFVGVEGVPRTVGLIQPVLLFLMVAASRALAQYLLGGNYRRLIANDVPVPQVLIYGAGEAGRQVWAALRKSRQMKVVGFLDDDPTLQGGTIGGLRIYAPRRVSEVAARRGVSEVLLALPSTSRRRRLEVVSMLRAASLSVRTLPGLMDLAHGRFQVSDIRPLQIEDLLGRDVVPPNRSLLERNVAGKVVMVTGGGGSIGSELCRQIASLKPTTLVIVDASEYSLYAIHRELVELTACGGAEIEIVPLLASVADEPRMGAILGVWTPHTIYHAAAYKHVPLVEQNVVAGVHNNVFGTLHLARQAVKHEVANFVLISTDKAVRPTNVMGASKRLSEIVLQALGELQETTRFSNVRFGNVLGSSGSVVPLFRRQIAEGGPVTITHPEVTRYFMTIPEAAQLVIQAAAMAEGGEVFVLDMGEPVLVADLAVNMIELSGLSVRNAENPDGDIEIAVVGLRAGEKLYEELLIGDDQKPTQHERIMQAREEFTPFMILMKQLDRLSQSIRDNDETACRALLREMVPEYQPNGEEVYGIAAAQARDPAALAAPASGVEQEDVAR